MEPAANAIRLAYTDPRINDLLKSLAADGEHRRRQGAPTGSHFNHTEEFFVTLPATIDIPQFPIHHDIRKTEPSPQYTAAVHAVVERIGSIAPWVLQDLTYLFRPDDTLRPSFFYLYRYAGLTYLYIMHLNLQFRPNEHRVIEPGTNDITAAYQTNRLYVDATLVPLQQVVVEDGRIQSFVIRQTVSQTWIGETGRGYLVQGIWIDRDLTKFFSRVFIPPGKRLYPYYPFVCRYRTICAGMIQLGPEKRRPMVPRLHRAIEFLVSHLPDIEAALHDSEFSEGLPVFQAIKAEVATEWAQEWDDLSVKPYLTDQDMKEFRVEGV